MRRTLRIARCDTTRWRADAIVPSTNVGLVGNAKPEFWRHRVPCRREHSMASTAPGYLRSANNADRQRDGNVGVPHLSIDGKVHAAAGPALQAALSVLASPRYENIRPSKLQPWRDALVPARTGPSAGGRVACLEAAGPATKKSQPGSKATVSIAGVQPPSQSGGASARGGSLDPSLASVVLQTAADAIVHTCPSGRIRTWNRGAAEVFGMPARDALGQDLTELVIPEDKRHIRPLDPKPNFDRKHLRRAPAVRSDGSRFTAEFTVQDLGEEDGGYDGHVVVLRDASEMGATVRKLRTRVAELESGMARLIDLSRPP